MIFTWIVAFLIGVYSALRPYSIGDYLATFLGFIGLATPNFMLALLLMWLFLELFGVSFTRAFSPRSLLAHHGPCQVCGYAYAPAYSHLGYWACRVQPA